MSDQKRHLPPAGAKLYKQQSWSPNWQAEEVWSKLKANQRRSRRRSKSVTDDDLTELKACFELGFGFESDEIEGDRRLSDVFPALELYRAVNKMSRSSSSSSIASSSCESLAESVIDLDGGPEAVKAKLKQWAQMVACSVSQSPRSS
ncbi:putative Glutamate receptor 2 plant [Heracleum sosnowskyi]|uniref:Glutamate receptor 2 plant n=1 Tax=Heracleum sosnowskyi TaxID=360622 RepID=A0AAD8JDI6_9APIA|nr:putative Glutamate receptor 2 plant [Heracleum sosnowskyi]